MTSLSPLRVLSAISVALLAIRLYAALHVGFGDSEALYVTWAAHPQPAYLDHPGLVGLIARAIGEGAIPSPGRVHLVTAVGATFVPWIVFDVARRSLGAETKHAATAALVVAVAPEIAVGLFALTPDLLLAPLWLLAIGLSIWGLRQDSPSLGRSIALLAAGLLAGVAASAKVSGLLLIVGLAVAYASVARMAGAKNSARDAARSIWPWAGLLAGIVVLLPIARYEARLGFPMLQHRLVDTQHAALGAGGVASSLVVNLGALAGGQLAYLSPIVLWLAFVVARDLVRRRDDDAASRVLFYSFAIPIVPLLLLCIWSPVAEPHWIAPPLLALPLHAARRGADLVTSARLVVSSIALAAALTLGVHAWVLIPSIPAAFMPKSADPKLDIATELYGWPQVIDAIKEEMGRAGTAFDPQGKEVIVVGPHWTVCAQLEAGLAQRESGIRVGCATPIRDDFDRWLDRSVWRKSDNVLFVTDNRFDTDGADQLPEHVRVSQQRVTILRASRTARVFQLYMYTHREAAMR